jgi:hypothetical protein
MLIARHSPGGDRFDRHSPGGDRFEVSLLMSLSYSVWSQ